MAILTIFIDDVAISAAGTEITNIIPGARYVQMGKVDQVVITRTSGAATTVDVSIRYLEGVATRDKLVYLFEAGDLPNFVDSEIGGSFSVKNPMTTEGNLHLFLEPDANCTVSIRIDLDV